MSRLIPILTHAQITYLPYMVRSSLDTIRFSRPVLQIAVCSQSLNAAISSARHYQLFITPLWKRRVAVITRSEWFILNPGTPPAWHTLATVLARVLCPIGDFVYNTDPLAFLEVLGTVQALRLLDKVASTSCIFEPGAAVGFWHWHDGLLTLVAPSCGKFHLHFFLNSPCIWGRVRHQTAQVTQSVWLEASDVFVHFFVHTTRTKKIVCPRWAISKQTLLPQAVLLFHHQSVLLFHHQSVLLFHHQSILHFHHQSVFV